MVSLWMEPRLWFLVSGVKSYHRASREGTGRARPGRHWVPSTGPPFPAKAEGPAPQGGSLSSPLPAWLCAICIIIYISENIWVLEPNYNENIFKLISTSF